jgi:GTP-binding protein
VKVLNADFVTSAARADDIPRDDLARIALAGRSNVGKSSLINALCRAKIARTSAAPGKTRLVNFYRVTIEGGGGPGRWSVYLVDLPGYGYARGGQSSREELARVAEGYFSGERTEKSRPSVGIARTPEDRIALLLVDSRHPGLDADVEAARWLDERNVRFCLVATKIDKLTRGERVRNLRTLETTFGMAPLPVSAASGEGMEGLWRTIARLAKNAA